MKRFPSVLCAVALLAIPVMDVFSTRALGQVSVSVGDQVGERGLFTARGFDAYCRILGLDDAQKAAARELMDGTTAANRTASDEMRTAMKGFGERMQAAMKKDGWSSAQKMMGEEMPAITAKYFETHSRLEKQFFDDVKGILSEAQGAKFPMLERYRRRETGFRGVQGAVDLLAVAEETHVDAGTGELDDILTRYEMELDRLLVERARLSKDIEKQMRDGMKDLDMAAIDKAQEPLKDNGLAIRELGRTAGGKVAGRLPEEKRAAFELEIKRREFPRVYREAHVVKAIDAALAMTDLDAMQRKALGELREQYARESSPLNLAWARAIDSKRESGLIRMVIDSDVGGRADPDKEVKDARRARSEFDDAIEKKLNGVLKEDQRSRLPIKRPEKPGLGLMGDGDEDMEGMGIKVMAVMESDGHDGPVEEGRKDEKEDR